LIYQLILPLPLPRLFDYRAAPEVNPATLGIGVLVTVPFGTREVAGLIVNISTSTSIAANKLKSISAVLPLPALSADFCDFLRFAARYTLTPPGMLLKMTLAGTMPPPPPVGEAIWQRLATATPTTCKPGSKGDRLLALLPNQTTTLTTESLHAAGLTASDAQALVKRGVLARRLQETLPPQPDPDHHQPQLTAAQQAAAAELVVSIVPPTAPAQHLQNLRPPAPRPPAPRPIVLQGVTGSGKTEVYSEAIAAALRHGQQVLVLMPEIALTTAMLSRFTQRFGAAPLVWHSGLSSAQRRAHWWAIARGTGRLIIGARSALFLPYATLGLLVVDEEHEAAYKQEEGTIYHARDMAVARAHHDKIPIILASATPSLESHVNIMQGRYAQVRLPERFGGAQLPSIQRIDMRAENLPASRFLSAPLVTALQETVAAGEQGMLFLNRRGYAPLTLCRSCGHRLQCPNCSAWLVLHKQRKKLQCHHCGYQALMPEHCPACQVPDKFAACGPGVERIAEEVTALLPHARVAVMASDVLTTPQAVAELLARVHRQEIDLLIGTQIMAKGYHFPNMTLVGIVDADLGLSGGDPRASERCYQLLQQVAGRTGRANKPGRALLQTFQPTHPVMQAMTAQDQTAFITAELAEREAYQLPPYKRLAALILSGAEQALVQRVAQQLAHAIPQDATLRLLGPAPAMLALLRGQHRIRLLLVADRNRSVQDSITAALASVPIPKALKLQIDIDPYSFF
jgi:primosomal protein N' (replication factor Y) (superfamily II helicase)